MKGEVFISNMEKVTGIKSETVDYLADDVLIYGLDDKAISKDISEK
jgi:hypothetical protein